LLALFFCLSGEIGFILKKPKEKKGREGFSNKIFEKISVKNGKILSI